MTAALLERIACYMRDFGFPSARVEERLSPSGASRVLGIEIRQFFFPDWELEDPVLLAKVMSGQFDVIAAARPGDWRAFRRIDSQMAESGAMGSSRQPTASVRQGRLSPDGPSGSTIVDEK